MATLVFDTIRTGFPTASLRVWLNDLPVEFAAKVCLKCVDVGATANEVKTIHHQWIEGLIAQKKEPFWICDTDVIFYSSMERFAFDSALTGWRIPEWVDAFSGAVTRARLHTSLLRIDPVLLREQVAAYESKLVESPFTPRVNLIYPLVIPCKGRAFFYDTCSLLYHAISGQCFTNEQKDAYCHFNFGTIPDLVLPRLPQDEVAVITAARSRILDNHAAGYGAWREQEEYYLNHQP